MISLVKELFQNNSALVFDKLTKQFLNLLWAVVALSVAGAGDYGEFVFAYSMVSVVSIAISLGLESYIATVKISRARLLRLVTQLSFLKLIFASAVFLVAYFILLDGMVVAWISLCVYGQCFSLYETVALRNLWFNRVAIRNFLGTVTVTVGKFVSLVVIEDIGAFAFMVGIELTLAGLLVSTLFKQPLKNYCDDINSMFISRYSRFCIKVILKKNLVMLIHKVNSVANSNISQLILGWFNRFDELSFYSIGVNLINGCYQMLAIYTNTSFFIAVRKGNRFNTLLRNNLWLSGLGGGGVFLLCLFARNLESFGGWGITINTVMLLCVIMPAFALNLQLVRILVRLGDQKYISLFSFLALFCNAVVGFTFVLKYGYVAAGSGVIFSSLLFLMFLSKRYTGRYEYDR